MAGFRNRIINGNGRIAQRGDVAIAANGAYYGGADRITVNPYGCTTVAGTAHQYYAGGFGISGYGQAFYNVTTTGAASSILFGTKIESQNEERRIKAMTREEKLKFIKANGKQ